MTGTPRRYDEPLDFKLLRIKHSLEALGLDVSDSTPATLLDLYRRLHDVVDADAETPPHEIREDGKCDTQEV